MSNSWNQISSGLSRARAGIAAATASGKFFERFLRCRVRLRVLRAHRQPPETQCCQLLADAAFVQHDAEFRLDAVLQVTATPAHHAVAHRVGTGLDPGRKRGQLFGCKPPGPMRHRPVHQPAEALGIVAMYPVPERLAVHPAGLRRRRAVNPLHHQRNRQHPPCRTRVLRLARSRAKLRRRQFPPRDRNPCHA